jgi:hypothetical protein
MFNFFKGKKTQDVQSITAAPNANGSISSNTSPVQQFSEDETKLFDNYIINTNINEKGFNLKSIENAGKTIKINITQDGLVTTNEEDVKQMSLIRLLSKLDVNISPDLPNTNLAPTHNIQANKSVEEAQQSVEEAQRLVERANETEKSAAELKLEEAKKDLIDAKSAEALNKSQQIYNEKLEKEKLEKEKLEKVEEEKIANKKNDGGSKRRTMNRRLFKKRATNRRLFKKRTTKRNIKKSTKRIRFL